MKNYLISVIALFFCAIMSQAQNSFIATLQHEGAFSHYYGSGALQSAYEAAQNGDSIMLSAGTFTFAGSFEKGLIVRGVGINYNACTVIKSAMELRSKDEKLKTSFEGIDFSSTVDVYNTESEHGQGNIGFKKCKIYTLCTNADSLFSEEQGPVTRVTNCIVKYSTYFRANSHPCVSFSNSYVARPYSDSEIGPNMTSFDNCVISYRYYEEGTYSSTYESKARSAYYLNFSNSIFVFDENAREYHSYSFGGGYYTPTTILPSTATVSNCLSIEINSNSCFSAIYNNGSCWYASNISDIFKTYVSGYASEDYFALTDSAAVTYLGTDGTQIGMQGGNSPYTPVVTYPIVTTLKAGKTTKDGMLKVEVGINEE